MEDFTLGQLLNHQVRIGLRGSANNFDNQEDPDFFRYDPSKK